MIKEIYINDVDVSGCEKLTRVLHNCKSKQVYDKVYEPCACKNNCEYKQLQRAKEIIERQEESCRIWHETLERNHFMKDSKVVQLEKEKEELNRMYGALLYEKEKFVTAYNQSEQDKYELEKHIEMLVNAINQGTKKFQYEEAPFLHKAMSKHFEFQTGLNIDDILGE